MNLFMTLALLLSVSSVVARESGDKGEKYRRSSLCVYLINEGEMPKVESIKKAFLDAPIPVKYNDHNVDERIFSVKVEELTDEQKAAFNAHKEQNSVKSKKKSGLLGAIKEASNAVAGGKSVLVDSQSKEDIEAATYHYLLNRNISKQLFDKWFISEDGKFTDVLLRERGLFDASVLDIQTAQSSLGGMDLLATEGEDLVKNTFIVASRFRYMSKDEVIAEGQKYAELAGNLAGKSGLGGLVSKAGGLGAKAVLGDGYYVIITSYLYQLVWNDEVKAKLYDLWDKKEQYDAADFFELKYIGSEKARSGVRAGMFSNKPEDELIRIATINASDAVLARLEKKYETFRTKTPLIINENGELTAYIGTKEDLEAGDRFEVLERSLNTKTNMYEYKKIGEIKVAKGKIWDNIYMATDNENSTADANGLTATVFEGNAKNFYNGLLIRQLD